MNTVLISPAEIESCWEKNDACFIKTKSGKVWVCEKYVDIDDFEIEDYAIGGHTIPTTEFIINNQSKSIVRLPIKKRGDNNG